MTESPSPVPPRKPSLWRQARAFIFIMVIFAALRSAVADWNDVPTGSMIPTILEGDRIFVNKLAYDLKLPFTTTHLATWGNPQRGDVVILYSPADGERLVKRVVAVPGDILELRENRLYLNGDASTYGPIDANSTAELNTTFKQAHIFSNETEPSPARTHAVMATPGLPARRWFGPVTVPPGKYFVMGDNRDNSFDSRYFGFVARDQIVGRAVGVVASLDLNNHWLPRWSRFFSGLK